MAKRLLSSCVLLGLFAGPTLACTKAQFDQKLKQVEANVERARQLTGDKDALGDALSFAREEGARLFKQNATRAEACTFLDSMILGTRPAE